MENALNENQNKIQLLERKIAHLETIVEIQNNTLQVKERLMVLFEDKINRIEQKNKELLLFRNINFN